MSVPPRTTADLVKGVLGGEYDAGNSNESPPRPAADLAAPIAAASNVVDNLLPVASRKGYNLDSVTQELIERWLAAHFYQAMDPGYTSRSTQGASGSFQDSSGQSPLEMTRFGKRALLLDFSGALRNLDKQQRASATWLGKNPIDQTPFWQRT